MFVLSLRPAMRMTAVMTAVLGFQILSIMPALAEVCDKENPRWNPADGPISPFGEAYYTLFSNFGLALAILILIVFLLNSRWLYLAFSIPIFLWGYLLRGEALEEPGVRYFAVQEGCRSDTIVTMFIFIIVGTIFLFLGIRKFVKKKSK